MFQDPNTLAARYPNEDVAWEERELHQGATPGPSPRAKVNRQIGLHLPEREVFRDRFLVARKSVHGIPGRRVSAWNEISIRNRAGLRLSQRHRSFLVSHCKITSYFKLSSSATQLSSIRSERPIQSDTESSENSCMSPNTANPLRLLRWLSSTRTTRPEALICKEPALRERGALTSQISCALQGGKFSLKTNIPSALMSRVEPVPKLSWPSLVH